MTYPAIDPVAFHIPWIHWPVYWYGLMYLFGFAAGWVLLSLRARVQNGKPFNQEQVADIVFYTALGAIIGGRLGYVLFYDIRTFLEHPLLIVQTWKGGMSFHGGLIGVLIANLLYLRKMEASLLTLTDFIAPVVPLGLGAGRIGNFINGELYGRITTSPLGTVFPQGGPEPRHPSQLYEAALEGVVLFIILWIFSRKPRPTGAVSGLFALLYGIFRIIGECFREPDANVGYLVGGLTEGQLLSMPLVLIGLYMLIYAYHKRKDLNA